jgi:N-acetylglucosaminyldiphosphoundecaprenol N-acetyl-beta-D-mannosaminyltransferase
MNKINFAGIKIDNFSMVEVKEKITEIIEKEKKTYIVTPNAAHIVLLQKDKEFYEIYKNAELVLADGISIVWASKILGTTLKERVTGADLFREICEIANRMGKSIFILGGVNESEKIAENKLKKMYPDMKVYSYSPPFGFENDSMESNKILNMINIPEADILFVCVGAPKSEKWFYKHLNVLNIKLICSFGAALDFFAGTKKRAPEWVQNIGLEWFWRLVQDPERLWKRYLVGNIIFISIVLKEIFNKVFLKSTS